MSREPQRPVKKKFTKETWSGGLGGREECHSVSKTILCDVDLEITGECSDVLLVLYFYDA
jgi:hypothetical protein